MTSSDELITTATSSFVKGKYYVYVGHEDEGILIDWI